MNMNYILSCLLAVGWRSLSFAIVRQDTSDISSWLLFHILGVRMMEHRLDEFNEMKLVVFSEDSFKRFRLWRPIYYRHIMN